MAIPSHRSRLERSRWRGGRCACDTPDIMGLPNRSESTFAYLFLTQTSFSMLQAKVDSIPIA
jgi:hypothetical protein